MTEEIINPAQDSLRNKIHKHVSSAAHLLAYKIRESKEQIGLEEPLEAQTVKVEHTTECVLRTAY